MTSQPILRALSYVDDAYLESAARSMRARPPIRRWAPAAACLVLACALLLAALLPRPDDGLILNAADVAASINGDPMDSIGTSSYRTLSSPYDLERYLAAPPDERALPVFEHHAEEVAPDLEGFTDFTDSMIGRICKALGYARPQYNIKEGWDGYYSVTAYSRYQLYASQTPTHESVSVVSSFFYLDGLRVAVGQSQTDEQILAALSSLRGTLFELFGVSFTDARVVRKYYQSHQIGGVSSLTVYFYNASAHPMNDMPGIEPCTDYVSLTFHPLGDEYRDQLSTVRATYARPRIDANRRFVLAGTAKMISLAEAEALLEAGYTFGCDHICSLCMKEQRPIDFSDYDYVSFEYFCNASKSTLSIPFYTFYKSLGQAENGNRIYAKTYVPALPVQGLEDYFHSNAK